MRASSRSIEDRLRRLEDIDAIRRLKMAYARLVDTRCDAQELADLFTEDAVMDMGPWGRYEGRAAIRAFFADFLQQSSGVILHYVTNHEIDVQESGLEATDRCLIWNPTTVQGEALLGTSTQLHRLRKVDGRWIIAEMRVEAHFLTPLVPGWIEAPNVSVAAGN